MYYGTARVTYNDHFTQI